MAKARATSDKRKRAARGTKPSGRKASARRVGKSPEPRKRSQKADSSGRAAKDELSDVVGGIANSASRVVQQAGEILENELAAGIRAAQKVKPRLIDVDRIRAAATDDLLPRFRRDAHDVVDIALDLVTAGFNAASEMSERIVKFQPGDGSRPPGRSGGESIPVLAFPDPIEPGQSAVVPMAVENDGDNSTAEFRFLSTDLISENGERLPSGRIEFEPPSISLRPRSKAKVQVSLKVSKGTPPGVYSGLLMATNLKQLQAVLRAQVL